jgi:integrase
MPKVRFFLNQAKTNIAGTAPIEAIVTIDYKRATKFTGHRVKPADWNKTPQPDSNGVLQYVKRNKTDRRYNDHTEINQALHTFNNEIQVYFRQCELNKIPIDQQLVKDYFAGKKKKLEVKSFWNAVDEYLRIVGIEMESSTTRTKRTFFKTLKSFQEKNGYTVDFEKMNMEFFNRYKIYVLETQNKSWNYLSVQFRILKAFLSWAAECNYYKGREHLKFKVAEKPISVVALTYDELIKLFNFEFESATHRKARDIFCFSAFTGLRVSDVLKLDEDHVHTDGMIRLVVQKTKKDIEIPIFPETQQIIDRYSEQYRLLPRMSEQRVNLYIKECCKLAGINSPVKYKHHPKGQMEEKTYPKHELIHTHTGRKTFITVSYKRGLDIEMIKNLTGITSEATIKKYLFIDGETKRERAMKAWGNGGKEGI